MLYAYSFPAVHLNAMQRTRRAYKGETGKVLLLSSTCCSLPRQQLFQPIDIVATRLRLVAPPPLTLVTFATSPICLSIAPNDVRFS